jgi:hypothetical protein
MKNEIAISELIPGLVSLVDGILSATEDAPSGSTGKQNINIVDALHLVRDRLEELKRTSGQCSADDLTASMNAIMAELRSRAS